MKDSGKVVVYNFRTFDRGHESAHLAPFKATREKILAWDGAQLLEGTEEVVPVSELDRDGHYRRIATGWGEL